MRGEGSLLIAMAYERFFGRQGSLRMTWHLHTDISVRTPSIKSTDRKPDGVLFGEVFPALADRLIHHPGKLDGVFSDLCRTTSPQPLRTTLPD